MIPRISKYLIFFIALLALNAMAEECEEPEPVGGASCEDNSECNGNAPSIYGENECVFTTTTNNGINITTGSCVCAYDYAMVDCEYKRYNKDLAGGLQFLAFAGVGGVGNLVAERDGEGAGQMIMMFAPFLICCVACCAFCGEEGAVAAYIVNIILGLVALAGFIWCMVDAGRFLGGEWPDGNGYFPYNGDCTFVLG
jgi:hypothetical protein